MHYAFVHWKRVVQDIVHSVFAQCRPAALGMCLCCGFCCSRCSRLLQASCGLHLLRKQQRRQPLATWADDFQFVLHVAASSTCVRVCVRRTLRVSWPPRLAVLLVTLNSHRRRAMGRCNTRGR